MFYVKKLISIGLLLAMLTINAGAVADPPAVRAKSAALYDSGGNLLYEYNGEEQLPPASVTKIMTMLLVMEAVDSGQVSFDDMVTGSAYAASMGGTQIWLKEGEQLSLRDMLKAIAVASANDCAVAVAEFLAGSEDAFVQKMNQRAKELGMKNTTFVNANGLDREGTQTITSAKDIGIMSAELLKHPTIKEFTTIWMDTIRNGEFTLANTNKMLKKYQGLNGLKTGFTTEAMYCISATAEKEGSEFIAVLMGEPTKEERNEDVAALLNYAFANYQTITPDSSQQIPPVPVTMGTESVVYGNMEKAGKITIPKEQAETVTESLELEESVDAPVVPGQRLGSYVLRSGDTVLAEIPIVAAQGVERIDFLGIYKHLLQGLFSEANES